jgi:hypothetical protein
MKKVYTKPVLVSRQINLGVFGDYGCDKPDKDHNDNGNHYGWFKMGD